jgi:hypothetical protein
VTIREARIGMTTGQHADHEIPAADGCHEAGKVEFVETDEEEKNEDPDAQEELNIPGWLDDPGNGSQQHPGQGVGHDRNQAEPAQNALGQLGYDNKQSNVEQGFADHVDDELRKSGKHGV